LTIISSLVNVTPALISRLMKIVNRFPGGYGGGATPVPIPNTAVKPSCADGTAALPWWESRTLPGIFYRGPVSTSDAGPLFLPTDGLQI
jgi:hypothetical protein